MAVHNRYFFCGGVRLQIDGYDRERFFNIAARRELKICEIKEDPETKKTSFWTTVEDFKKMKAVTKKAGAKLHITGRFGLPFFLYRNRKRKLLALGVCSFFIMLYALSFFIWDISFEGNLRFPDEMILHYMETLPVSCGMRKSDISCEDLEGEIRNHFTEITWVSAEIAGTRLIIRVKENEALLAPQEKDTTPRDLSAAKNGTIVRTVTRSGICQVKAGDQVEAGQLLVSGTIPIYDDSETLVNSHEVHSDAEIYAKTVYNYEKKLPVSYTKKARTGKIRKGFFVKVFDHSFYFLLPAAGDKSWEFFMEQEQLKLFRDFYLPVYGSVLTAREYVPYEKVYTMEEIRQIADGYEAEYMEKLREKGVQILGNDDRIEMNESGVKIRGTLTVVEDIAKAAPIPEKYEENQTVNEHN